MIGAPVRVFVWNDTINCTAVALGLIDCIAREGKSRSIVGTVSGTSISHRAALVDRRLPLYLESIVGTVALALL